MSTIQLRDDISEYLSHIDDITFLTQVAAFPYNMVK
jgi:hypothetical protein